MMTWYLLSAFMLEPIPLTPKLYEIFLDRDVEEGVSEEQDRMFIAFLASADAMNRAGSADPEAIREAPAKTNIPVSYPALPWQGIKFDENGQNTYANPIITKRRDGRLKGLWPKQIAESEIVWHLSA